MIKLKRIGQGRMTGETVNDQDLLRVCGCPLYFWESEVDVILWKVGKQGLGLEYPKGE